MSSIKVILIFLVFIISCNDKNSSQSENRENFLEHGKEKHRPYFHFTPDSMWMNDPNGMVFYKDTYHLFYQYYPEATVWGPMHWGHAVSKDMVNWEHKPIALYPDDLGYIFSGSAVLDVKNTSGFGTEENPPLVAIYTYHDPEKAKAKQIDVESQGIAYSLNDGETWIKYNKNPVLLNPNIRDFRDPKVRWYEQNQRWVMTLAAQDHIRFYSSPDLKEWSLESEFGKELGAHGGVWECPDLFPLRIDGSDDFKWILIVSINPGGPNGGSATQYFVGDFNGSVFKPLDTKIRWIDYGPDDYAGVTWSNTAEKIIFMGWMSNWKYANKVPTEKWRSAMTIARELTLMKSNEDYAISSLPVKEFDKTLSRVFEKEDITIEKNTPLVFSKDMKSASSTFVLDLEIEDVDEFKLVLSNESANQVSFSYMKKDNIFMIDRSKSGDLSFHHEFGNKIVASRFSEASSLKLKLVIDVASMEVFADDGTTVMTAIYFPNEILNSIEIVSESTLSISKISLMEVN